MSVHVYRQKLLHSCLPSWHFAPWNEGLQEFNEDYAIFQIFCKISYFIAGVFQLVVQPVLEGFLLRCVELLAAAKGLFQFRRHGNTAILAVQWQATARRSI